MPDFTITDLSHAKSAVSAALDGLGLAAHLFAVEPRDGAWAVVVECAIDTGWQRVELQASAEILAASLDDPAARAALMAQWQAPLAACKRG